MKQQRPAATPPDITAFRLPRYREIPTVGLYLEQTVRYVGLCLAPLGDAGLTASMVSNYVKQGLVPNPVKKQYAVDHIALLLFIAVAKTVMSLEDIRLLLELQQAQVPLPQAYDRFCDALEAMLREVFQLPGGPVGPPEDTPLEVLLHTILTAVAHKLYLDAALAACRETEEKTPSRP